MVATRGVLYGLTEHFFVSWMFPLGTMAWGTALFLVLLVFVPASRLFLLAYVGFAMVDRTYANGGAEWTRKYGVLRWFRNFSGWKYALDYFPYKLKKTVDLPQDKAYVFGFHPHGLVGAGLGAVTTDAVGWAALFPGIRVHPVVLKFLFFIPFYRDWLYAHDVICADKDSLRKALEKGDSICIPVGGASEALEAFPKTMRVLVKRRKGLIKVALETGASLVPILSIGENDMFEQVPNPKGSLLRMVQDKLKALCSFSMPVVRGRDWLPMFPKRTPVTVVVGSPIHTEKCTNPSRDVIDATHAKYVAGIVALYDRFKAESGYKDVPLEIVG
mmetsp:Transcript_4483/g.13598  ORF Transcript_4483/g.13598 Transcript_4483/m.13598 type:complete len:330 (+) Transcript_4483:97-1086(+)